MDRQARLEQQTKVQRVIARVKPRLMAIPGVRSVAVGLRSKADALTEDIVMRVCVDRKRPESEIPPDQVIPREIEGIATDVFEWTPTVPAADTSRYRPLMGGIQIGNGSGGHGTLGCFAKRNAEDDWVMLSNHHVMFNGKSVTATNIEVSQPSFGCCCCCRTGEVGRVLAGSIGGQVDCAIASINTDVAHVQEIVEVGGITGTAVAVVGDTVRKRGRTTGLTTGIVQMIDFDTTDLDDQILVFPDAEHPFFVDLGDSGSALVNDANEVIGLIWGKNGRHGAANHIAQVEAALNITVVAVANAVAAQVPVAKMPPAGSDGVIRRRDWEAMFRAELDSDDPVAGRIARHWEEVWRLIQTNREVGLRWQRGQGPAYAAAFERTTRVTGYRVPADVDGVTLTQLLLSMAAALEQHGSPELRADIRDEAIGWIPQLQACRSADALWLEYQRIKEAARQRLARADAATG